MATPSFQLYADKENISSIGPLQKARARHGIAPVTKLFGASNGPTSFPTPVRKALGDMNKDPHAATPTFTPKQKNFLNGPFKKPVAAPTPIKSQPLCARPVNVVLQQEQTLKSRKSKGPSTDVFKPVTKQEDRVQDDIERGYIFEEEADDYEDIWPRKDRPSSYLHAIISWRPPCFRAPELDDREEEERKRELAERIHKDAENFIEYPEKLDDFPLPPQEILPCPSLDMDIPLPSLDESLDIVQHIGSLTLKED